MSKAIKKDFGLSQALTQKSFEFSIGDKDVIFFLILY